MRRSAEDGMTILEVIIAIIIFMIGITFVLQMDAVSHKHFNQGQVRQQMLFYASGVLEGVIEGLGEGDFEEFADFDLDIDLDHGLPHEAGAEHPNDYLQVIKVTVTSPSVPEPVELYTYRVNYDAEE